MVKIHPASLPMKNKYHKNALEHSMVISKYNLRKKCHATKTLNSNLKYLK